MDLNQFLINFIAQQFNTGIAKKGVLQSIATLAGVNSNIVSYALQVYDATGQWPTADYLCASFGVTPAAPLDPNMSVADIYGYFAASADAISLSKVKEELFTLVQKPDVNLTQILGELNQMATRHSKVMKGTSFKSARDRYDYQKTQPAGLLTSINPVDVAIGGVQKGSILTLCGAPGSFKTSTAISCAYVNVVNCGWNGVFFSLEMPKELLWYYVLSRHSTHPKFASIHDPVDKSKMIKTLLTDEEYQFIFDVVEPDLQNCPDYGKLEILDRTDFENFHPTGVRSRLSRLPFELEFGIVDYMQLFKFLPEAKAYGGQIEFANTMVGCFKDIAVEFNGKPTAWILLSQANREGQAEADANDGSYTLRGLAELNALERDAAYSAFLYANDDLRASNELKVNLPKNRFGSTFEDAVTTFVDPKFCIVGEAVEGVGTSASNVDFSSMLSGGFDL